MLDTYMYTQLMEIPMGRPKLYHTEDERKIAHKLQRASKVTEESKVKNKLAQNICNLNRVGEYFRNCPSCGESIKCNNLYQFNRYVKLNRRCKSCAAKEKEFSEEHRKNLSIANTGKTQPIEQCKKTSERLLGSRHTEETRKKMSESQSLRYINPENRCILRRAAVERFKKLGIAPRYNKKACDVIEEYGKQHNYNFQHALNGGEYYIEELGYFVDGYDKEKNVVIEYYEKAHRSKSEKDERRKLEIIDKLGCEFIELKEWL